MAETRQPTRWPTSIRYWLAFGLAIAMYWDVGTSREGGRWFPRPIVTTALVAWPLLLGIGTAVAAVESKRRSGWSARTVVLVEVCLIAILTSWWFWRAAIFFGSFAPLDSPD